MSKTPTHLVGHVISEAVEGENVEQFRCEIFDPNAVQLVVLASEDAPELPSTARLQPQELAETESSAVASLPVRRE